jgi:hypothetical protein
MPVKKSSGTKSPEKGMMYAIGFWITGRMVAAADGDIDKREIAAHGGMIKALAMESKSALVRTAAGEITSDPMAVSKAYLDSNLDDAEILRTIAKQLKRETETDRNRYLSAVFIISGAVGGASGGGWLGGDKLSPDEAKMTLVIHALLSDMQDVDRLQAWIKKNGI